MSSLLVALFVLPWSCYVRRSENWEANRAGGEHSAVGLRSRLTLQSAGGTTRLSHPSAAVLAAGRGGGVRGSGSGPLNSPLRVLAFCSVF